MRRVGVREWIWRYEVVTDGRVEYLELAAPDVATAEDRVRRARPGAHALRPAGRRPRHRGSARLGGLLGRDGPPPAA